MIIRRKGTIKNIVNVIGCGFAGIECALFLADHGVNVHIFDCASDKYRCNCLNCELFGINEENEEYARELLRKELKSLGSTLVEKEDELRFKEKYSSCVADRLLEYGKDRVKNHPKIEFFELCVNELNLKEVNVVASGPHTRSGLISFLKDLHGSMRMFDSFGIYPLVQGIDEGKFFRRGDELFLPFTYEEYISLCNQILMERNALVEKGVVLSKELGLIEEKVREERDKLKNDIMRPIFIDSLEEKPYACLKLNILKRGYEIEGFASALPPESQYRIINSIKGLENAVILNAGKSIENSYINAPFVINRFCQSSKIENIFYAGNISGVFGHIESMASGLYVGYNVLNFLNGRRLAALPKESAIGALIEKVITTSVCKNRPIVASYDLIKTENEYKTLSGKKKYLFDNSEKVINKFKEECFNGKHV